MALRHILKKLGIAGILNLDNRTPRLQSYEAGNLSQAENLTSYCPEDAECSEVALFETYDRGLLYFGAFICISASVVGVLGNVITAAALIRCKSLRNATTAFIINLCVCDCVYCAFVTPLLAATMLREKWQYGDILCIVQAFMQFFTRTVSAFTIGIIALNRYMLIIHSGYYGKIFTNRGITIIIVWLWVIAVSCFIPTLMNSWGTYGFSNDLGICTLLHLTPEKHAPVTVFSIIAAMVGLLGCCILYCYLRIYLAVRLSARKINTHRDDAVTSSLTRTLRSNRTTSSNSLQNAVDGSESNATSTGSLARKRQQGVDSQDMEIRVIRMSVVIFCVFVLSFVPIVIIRLAELEDQAPYLHILAYLCLSFGACINPLIYVVMSREYRSAYKSFVLWIFKKDKLEISQSNS